MFLFQADAGNFHIQTVTKEPLQLLQSLFGFRFAVLQKQAPYRPFHAAGQTNQAVAVPFQVSQGNLGFFLCRRSVQVGYFHQVHYIGITFGIHYQNNDFIGFNNPPLRFEHVLRIGIAEIELAAENRLNPLIGSIF